MITNRKFAKWLTGLFIGILIGVIVFIFVMVANNMLAKNDRQEIAAYDPLKAFSVTLLFEIDGAKIYRFVDGSNVVYVSKNATTQYTAGSKYRYRVTTLVADTIFYETLIPLDNTKKK